MNQHRAPTPSALVSLGAGAAVVGASLSTALVLATADYAFRKITRPGGTATLRSYTYTPWEVGLPWLDVAIPTTRGPLPAWWIPAEQPDAPIIVPLAGHGRSKSDLLGIARYLWQAGFSCLMVDYRGLSETDGFIHSTLGFQETDDVLATIDWLARRNPGSPIGLLGYSMGGSIAILATARDSRIGAVISDCGFSSQRDVVAYHVRRRVHIRPAASAVTAATGALLRRRAGFAMDGVEPRAEIARIAPRPVFIIHGERDEIVPPAHAEEMYAAAGEPRRLWIIDGARHVEGYFVDRLRYCNEVAAFFEATLRSGAAEQVAAG